MCHPETQRVPIRITGFYTIEGRPAQTTDVIIALAKSAKDSEADDDDGERFGEAEEPQLSKQEIHHAQLNQPQNRGDTAQARHPLNL